MPISLPKYGTGYRVTIRIDPDQADYLERKARIDRTSNSQLARRAIDLLMRVEPLASETVTGDSHDRN